MTQSKDEQPSNPTTETPNPIDLDTSVDSKSSEATNSSPELEPKPKEQGSSAVTESATDDQEPQKPEQKPEPQAAPELASTGESIDKPEQTGTPNPPKANESDSVPAVSRKGRGLGTIVLALVLLMVIAALGGGAWWLYPQWQQQQQELKTLTAKVAQAQSRAESLQSELSQFSTSSQRTLSQSQTQYQTLEQQLRAATERLDVHNQRLLSLSNTSREDWQLAEAHYLLRLASQRLLVDRQATSALGLMETTDGILRELALPDLFPVRQALADDLAAVRLAAQVDREGIYLRLAGLINNMEKLPLYKIPEVTVTTATEGGSDEAQTSNWWRELSATIGERLSRYFSLRNHDEFAAPLLPPSAGEYLRQNIRLSLEQAQIAMLREQTEIYQACLAQAQDIIARYFPESPAKAALVAELDALKTKIIKINLPQIDSSLSQLQAYIERLHRLESRVESTEAAE